MSRTLRTDVAGRSPTLAEVAAQIPADVTQHLIRSCLAEGQTPAQALSFVVRWLVGSGEIADSQNLRTLIGVWVGAAARRPLPPSREPPVRPPAPGPELARRTVAATVLEHERQPVPHTIEAGPDPEEEP